MRFEKIGVIKVRIAEKAETKICFLPGQILMVSKHYVLNPKIMYFVSLTSIGEKT